MRIKVPYKKYCPKGVDERTWRIVVDAWQNGLSDREAAFRASEEGTKHVKESDIKKWIADDPEVGGLRDFLHSDIISQAKLNIAEKIKDGDTQTSKWYLERKAADEFSTKSAVAFEDAVISVSIEEKEKAMKDFLSQFGAEDAE